MTKKYIILIAVLCSQFLFSSERLNNQQTIKIISAEFDKAILALSSANPPQEFKKILKLAEENENDCIKEPCQRSLPSNYLAISLSDLRHLIQQNQNSLNTPRGFDYSQEITHAKEILERVYSLIRTYLDNNQ